MNRTHKNRVSKPLLLLVSFLSLTLCCSSQSGPYDVAPVNGHYSFSYQQTPEDLVPLNPANTASVYGWQSSTDPFFNYPNTVGNSAGLSFGNTHLAQTTWFRRVANVNGVAIYSNAVKIEVVSTNWEDLNYVREHDILEPGHTDWKDIDALKIGKKLQTTTYMDGMGRPIQKVARETATPANPGDPTSLWGDMVQFHQYDPQLGRQPKQYLPYTTTTESGKYKSDPLGSQSTYYGSNYNESYAYTNASLYDNSPLNRILKANQPGNSWYNSNGNQAAYELNDASDNVQIFGIGYNTGDYPINLGTYPDYTLFRNRHTDENGHQVVDYTNMSGQLVLTKTQIDETPTSAHAGWICTYSVYDDFGLLRYRITPEAVKWLDLNGWSFNSTAGQQVLDGLCFSYEYDAKKRNITKKSPGAQQLNMLYDGRDRAVFMQDGNQAANGEWTANLYDNLDRTVMVALYRPGKTRAQLQTDINGADGANGAASTATGGSQPLTDPQYDTRDQAAFPSAYTATNSITFNPGFTSPDGDNFSAYIDAGATTPGNVIVTDRPATYGSPIADLTSGAVTIIKYLYYDTYKFVDAQPFTGNFDNTQAYPASLADPIATDPRTLSMPTGTRVRALGTGTFLASTIYYDAEGRPVQSNSGNIKGGRDVSTHQYQWDGRLLSSNTKHTAPGTAFSNYSVITKNSFDKLGRMTLLEKNYGGTGFKSIASYDYDDMGRLKTKHLDPGYTNSTTGTTEMEALTYSYNIHNQITGINKDYALKAGNYSKWSNYFGLYLGYDDGTNFTNRQLDGHVAGQMWNTQGDDAQRKYSYAYDNAGRLSRADFLEKNPAIGQSGQTWNNSKLDFSVTGHGADNTIQYDLNGNMQNMVQMGIQIGASSPLKVDDLAYSYAQYSNKLAKVTDNGSLGTANGSLGDFKDGTNTGDDYVYDANGNLVVDLNKNVQNGSNGAGITYNFLDKPEQITIQGKGVINILYDADGDKLQRTFTPTNGTAVTTTYIGGFVYQGNSLQFINFEEGRLRSLPYTSTGTTYNGQTVDAVQINGSMDLPGNQRGVFDFFIRDYQQNVRMITTEETHIGYNTATMENDRKTAEDPIFQGNNNELENTRYNTPSGWQNAGNGSASVSRLGNNAAGKVGPNSLLKVMAGDQLTTTTDYYYEPGSNNSGTVAGSVLNSLLGALAGGGANLPTGVEGSANATAITGQLGLDGDFNDYVNTPGGYNGPKAYLNVLFFDERFQFIRENSTSMPVGAAGAGNISPFTARAPKNGYAYIYVSNASDQDVFFDNLKVADERGRLIEENHYYAYGLKISGISSKKLPDASEVANIKNNYQYQGGFSELDEDVGWSDFELRNYDPQLGRWIQMDPYEEFPSPYVGMGNDPVNNIDEDGGGIESVLIGAAIGGTAGFLIAKNNGASTGGSLFAGFGGALLGAGLGYATAESLSPGTMAEFNESTSFFSNFKAFYSGLLGNGGSWLQNNAFGTNGLWTPNIWGGSGVAGLATFADGASRILPHLAKAAIDLGSKPPTPMAQPNLHPTPPTGLKAIPPPVQPAPQLKPKPKTTPFDFTQDGRLTDSPPLFDRTMSEEQEGFADGIAKRVRSMCKTCIIQSVDVQVPIANTDPSGLDATSWAGSTSANRWGQRVDLRPIMGTRPVNGNGYSGASNILSQGMLMGRQILKGLGGQKGAAIHASLLQYGSTKFTIRIKGLCIN